MYKYYNELYVYYYIPHISHGRRLVVVQFREITRHTVTGQLATSCEWKKGVRSGWVGSCTCSAAPTPLNPLHFKFSGMRRHFSKGSAALWQTGKKTWQEQCWTALFLFKLTQYLQEKDNLTCCWTKAIVRLRKRFKCNKYNFVVIIYKIKLLINKIKSQ